MASLFGPGSRQIAQVLPYLYLSDISCAADNVVAQVGFTHIISILSGPIPWLGPSPASPASVLTITCDDDPEVDIIPHFERVNQFILDARKSSGPNAKILCHCLAGVSRSPTLVAAYLIAVLGMKRDDALQLIRERREVVEPNHGFLHQLAVYEARLRGTPPPPVSNVITVGAATVVVSPMTPTTAANHQWTPCIAPPSRNTAPRIRIPLARA